ncbi:MAG: Ig-like domain-containing protein, partial [Thermoplasmatales archaeon]|nr:Ig-like domain-containing protein [Thermoplasmatales archaeon]
MMYRKRKDAGMCCLNVFVVGVIAAMIVLSVLMPIPTTKGVVTELDTSGISKAGYSISVSTDKAYYNPGDSVNVGGDLTYNGAGVEGNGVSIQIKDPDGANVFGGSTSTDAVGHYFVISVLSQDAEFGTYTVYVTGSGTGATNTTTFTVGPWTVDYIQIRSASGDGGSVVTNLDLHYPSDSSSLYAARYNTTGGFIGDSPVATTTWTSTAPGVAAVSSPANPATVTSVNAGSATITANDGGKTNTASVTVTAWAFDDLRIRDASGGGGSVVTSFSLASGGATKQLWAARYNQASGTYLGDSPATITWTSTNTGVAAVSSPANPTTVTSVNAGSATINATDGTIYNTASVTVTAYYTVDDLKI